MAKARRKKSDTLECQLCGERAADLVPHIQSEHADEMDLREYLQKFCDGNMDGVIHPTLQAEAGIERETDETEGEVKVAGSSVKIRVNGSTVNIPKRAGLSAELQTLVLPINESYRFQVFTKDVLYDIQSKKPCAATGHTGSGKTSLFEQLSARMNQPFIKVNTNQQTSIHDFVGTWGVKGGETVWIDGALPYAMRNGCWLLIDEIDYAEPAILSALNAVLERRTLMLKEKGNEVVQAHEDFRIFATGNTLGQMTEYRGLYQGTNVMNEAFLDRFKLYLVDYMPEDLEVEVLSEAVPLMTENVAREMVRVASAIRKAFVEETVMCSFSTRRLLEWAEMMIHHRDKKKEAPFYSANATIFSKVSKEDELVVKGIIQRILLGRG